MTLRPTILLLFSASVHALHLPDFPRDLNHSVRTTFTYMPIKTGYVAFGDSYAAGIGAGTTSWDGCRIGSASYPNQLNAYIAQYQSGVDFQNLPCTGAVVNDLLQGSSNSQIDKWTNPGLADRATLSIGGNDVGFFDILDACVLRIGQALWSKDCNDQILKAQLVMNGDSFSNDLESALHQILDKSGRDDFRIIHTGYPVFFNTDTTSCDYTTFYFWQPGHHIIHHAGNWAYLYTDLRKTLNALVWDFNTKLAAIGDKVNQDYPEPRVIFADPNTAFNGHRFCEEGITEPDSSIQSTFLFLASWPDYSVGGEALPLDSEPLSAISIPDNATCDSTNDWTDLGLCEMAEAGIAWNSADGLQIAPSIEAPDGTEINTDELSGFIKTDWAKTFHPRSQGHQAYMNLVTSVW